MSDLEETLDFQLRALKIGGYGREVKFHPERRFRADFLWGPPVMLMVEVDGGTYMQGRHVRPKGFEGDRDKDLLAFLMGYRILHVSAKQVKSGEASAAIETHLKNYGSAA